MTEIKHIKDIPTKCVPCRSPQCKTGPKNIDERGGEYHMLFDQHTYKLVPEI